MSKKQLIYGTIILLLISGIIYFYSNPNPDLRLLDYQMSGECDSQQKDLVKLFVGSDIEDWYKDKGIGSIEIIWKDEKENFWCYFFTGQGGVIKATIVVKYQDGDKVKEENLEYKLSKNIILQRVKRDLKLMNKIQENFEIPSEETPEKAKSKSKLNIKTKLKKNASTKEKRKKKVSADDYF